MADESALEHVIAVKSHLGGIDELIAALAERQHGVVGRAQLVRLGLGRGAIVHRLDCGRLHELHRGVYAVGHRVLSTKARWMAAVLAGAPGAVLSHRAAAASHGMRFTARRDIDVTVPKPRRSRPGIGFHRGRLAFDEVVEVDGIPVTTPPRTLLDLAGVVPRRQLERALDEAEVLRLTDPLSVGDMVQRHPSRRGTAALRAILATKEIGANITRSELEDRFLAFLDDQGLPRPKVNAMIEVAGEMFEVDCLWPGHRLIAELDGHATHATSAAFERDRARDRILHAAGWRVIRVTWRQLHQEPAAVAEDLRTLTLLRP